MNRKNKRIFQILVVIFILVLLGSFIRLPYYVSTPGMAQELDPIIEVQNGSKSKGDFHLTTVRMGRANIFSYIWAKFDKYHYIYPLDHIRKENESDEEYTNRQLFYMEDSQEAAITVAYTYANKDVRVENHGIYVMNLVKGMPAEKQLKPGDRIFEVDGISISHQDEFIEYVSAKKENDVVELKIERNDKEQTVKVPIVKFPDNPEKIGIGISLLTDVEVITNPKVTIDTNKIGGPSAGLMFTIEIYDQLVDKDLTKGLKIAGTGTINKDGEVGPIGGISQKIVAADKEGIDIFFAPNEKGSPDSDYQEAIKTAKDIKTDMIIVPVDTFEDALEYLKSL